MERFSVPVVDAWFLELRVPVGGWVGWRWVGVVGVVGRRKSEVLG